MMARYRRSLVPINRIKHVVDSSATVAAAAVTPFRIVTSDESPVLANVEECEFGSKVNGIYLRMEVASNEAISLGAIPNVYMYFWKNPGGNLTRPTPNNVGVNDNKRFVIHQEMSMIENKGQGSNARTLFNGVIVIPKGMRRNGPNDIWEVVFQCPALDTAVCIQAHYKEFR